MEMLKTLNTSTQVERYYVNGKRTSKDAYWHLQEIAIRQGSTTSCYITTSKLNNKGELIYFHRHFCQPDKELA